jgi:hypothetical protein
MVKPKAGSRDVVRLPRYCTVTDWLLAKVPVTLICPRPFWLCET